MARSRDQGDKKLAVCDIWLIFALVTVQRCAFCMVTVECYEKEMFCNCSLIDFCSSHEFTWFVCPLLYEKRVKKKLYRPKESQMLEACGPIVVVDYSMKWHGGIVYQ